MTPPIILDIEASGFGAGSYPIEVGYIAEEGQMWCSLITPDPNWKHWDSEAEKLHQISREILSKYGKDATMIARHLNDVFQNKVVYSDGWGHDFIWMSRLFDRVDMAPHFKLEDLRKVLTPEQQAIWHPTKDEVLARLQSNRHRASTDAKVIQLTWIETLEKSSRVQVCA